MITVLDGVDDGVAALDLGANTFRYFGVTYTGAASLYVSSNGLITFGSGNNAYVNGNMLAEPAQAALAVYWDDLRTDRDVADAVLARFDDLDGDGVADRLIIEWSEVPHFSSNASTGTFQAILQLNSGSTDGNVIFNYIDVDFGSSLLNASASATVGLKPAGSQGFYRVLISKDQQHPLIGNDKALVIDRARPEAQIVEIASPRSSPVDFVDVVFSEPIDAASFDWHDVALSRDGGSNLVNGNVLVTRIDATTFRIEGLAGLTADEGNYLLSVDLTGITELVGHAGAGNVTSQWIMAAWFNHAPVALDSAIAANEDLPLTFAAGDFGFDDPNDSPPHALLAVINETLPAHAELLPSGQAVSAS